MTHPSSLEDLTRDHRLSRPWLANLVLPEIGGGRQSVEALTALASMPKATALMISGLDQATFENLVAHYAKQFRGIYFWKCPRIEDLTPLEDLRELKYVAFYWNQRTTRLWDFSRTPNLLGFEFMDFTRLHDLSDLSLATSLEDLSFGDMVWTTSVFESLEPLRALSSLRSLHFTAKKIDDGNIKALASLVQLKTLEFPSNLFTTQQIAWLRARLPDSVNGISLVPVRRYQKPIGEGDSIRDVLVIGKRKPFLHSKQHADRIERYERDFWEMVDAFRNDPTADPE